MSKRFVFVKPDTGAKLTYILVAQGVQVPLIVVGEKYAGGKCKQYAVHSVVTTAFCGKVRLQTGKNVVSGSQNILPVHSQGITSFLVKDEYSRLSGPTAVTPQR